MTVPVPVTPPPIARPIADVPYAQEINHTTPELPAGSGPLVAVVIGADGAPIAVGPHGIMGGTVVADELFAVSDTV